MSGDSPVEALLGVLAAAVILSLIAPKLDPITSVDLGMWVTLLWGVLILGVVAIFAAAVQRISAGGGR